MASVVTLTKLSQAANPKVALLTGVGDLSTTEIMGNRVLVAIYIAPEKTKGGIFRATDTVKEDVYQGTVGLVLKLGASAFVDESETKTFFHDQKATVGDWVVLTPGDGRRTQIRGIDCRVVEDTLIQMIVQEPDLITHEGK